jgi:hypothetical protein
MADIGTTFNAPFTDPVSSFIGNAPAQSPAAPQPKAEPAPQIKPAPSAQPLAQAKPSQGLVGKAEQFYQDILPKYQKAEEAERALDLGAKTAAFEGEQQKGIKYAEANKKYLENTLGSDAYKNLDATVNELAKNSAFRPTQENAKDLSMIFTLISLVGFGIGKGAKGNAQAAMSAMNGMLEGHQQGREDLYKKEKDIFDTNFKALQNKVTVLQEAYKRVQEIAATDRKTAEIEADQIPNKYGADFLREWQRKFGTEPTVKSLDRSAEAFKHIEDLIDKSQTRALQGMTVMQGADGWYAVYPATGQMKLIPGSQGLTKPGGTMATGEAYALINRYKIPPEEISRLNADNVKFVAGNVESARVTSELADLIQKNPTAAGIAGQYLNKIDKYLPSRYDNTDALSMAASIKTAIDSDTDVTGTPDEITEARIIAKKALDVINARALSVSKRLLVSELRMQKEVLDPTTMSAASAPKVYKELAASDIDKTIQVGFTDPTINLLKKELNIPVGEAVAAKPMPDQTKLKAYADVHFNGDVSKATQYLQSQGYK